MSAIVAGSFYGANPIEKSRDRSGGRLGSDRLRSTSQRYVGPSDRSSSLRRQLVDEDVLVNLDDVPGP